MATTYAPMCSLLVSNAGGLTQSLPDVRAGGKERVWIEKIALAGQNTADQIMVARLPYGSVPTDLLVATDTSLGAAPTIAFGDKINVSRFAVAGVLTATTGWASRLLPATAGIPLTTAYDYAGVASQKYEDVLLTIGVSSLASTGTMTVLTKYIDYGS